MTRHQRAAFHSCVSVRTAKSDVYKPGRRDIFSGVCEFGTAESITAQLRSFGVGILSLAIGAAASAVVSDNC